MRHWAVAVPAERYAQERMVRNAELRGGGGGPGGPVVLGAATPPPVVFGLAGGVRVGWLRYTRRLFDAPLPADGLTAGPLTEDAYATLAAKAGPARPVRAWLV